MSGKSALPSQLACTFVVSLKHQTSFVMKKPNYFVTSLCLKALAAIDLISLWLAAITSDQGVF